MRGQEGFASPLSGAGAGVGDLSGVCAGMCLLALGTCQDIRLVSSIIHV